MAKKKLDEEDVLAIQIKHFLELDDNRKTLNRLAASVERQGNLIKRELWDHVQEHGGPTREVVHADYRLTIHTTNGLVSWKDEFIKIAGAAAAEDLLTKAEKRETLMIEPLTVADANLERAA
jgi:hypothetical protein